MKLLEHTKMSRRIGERLVDNGVITEGQLLHAIDHQKRHGGFLASILVSLGFSSPSTVGPFLEESTGFPFVDIGFVHIDTDLAWQLEERFAAAMKVLPFREEAGKVHVAMADPLDVELVEILRTKLGKPIVPVLALEEDLILTIRKAFDVRHRTKALIQEMEQQTVPAELDVEDEDESLESDDAPVVRLLNQVVSAAMAAGASDIHIEPRDEHIRVRYRIDGILYDQIALPRQHLAPIMSRLKIMSGLNIAESRRPQDGRFATTTQTGAQLDVRLSLMPTVHGEKACMRLLEKNTDHLQLERLGFDALQLAQLRRLIRKPHGLILVTGPTGSGKTTTLYAALQEINDSSRNLNTIEDPVEYQLPNVNQVQVNPKIGVTFASGLRTLVRQDPDVILVGEIRDRETAEIAVQAALTGHLVLSTLHTNDAPGAVTRLQNMGIEPYLIASALIGTMSQRLLRANCPHCTSLYTPGEEVYLSAGLPFDAANPAPMARGAGCPRCGGRGTRGRTAASELMVVNDEIRAAILRNASGGDLYNVARNEGMRSIRDVACDKALKHEVSPEEVIRVFAQED